MVKTVSTKRKKIWVNLSDNFPNTLSNKKYPLAILKVLINRGIIELKEFKNKERLNKKIIQFLDSEYEVNIHDPFLLADIDKAVKRINKAVESQEKICVYGDYDVDGITSTALLSTLFEALGADFLAYIPSRHNEGYGLNKEAIQELKEKNVGLIITVDCGIRSFEEVEFANSLAIDVIVTDHHEIERQKSKSKSQNDNSKFKNKSSKDKIPNAIAVINPKRSDCKYPFKDLAGVGVAFKLACAVLSKDLILAKGWEKWLLDLVALGTVCDVVPLRGENRIFAKYGLKVLSKTKREGLKALFKSAGIVKEEIKIRNLGFHIGPRLNAAGRLETAKISLDLLLTRDTEEAERLTLKLSKLNKERQDITEKILEEAKSQIIKLDKNQKIYLLGNSNWPAGVVGIVASKLVDYFGKPVLITEEKNGEHKGSARSIKKFDIIEALEKCEDILVKYGGHKKAAGFTVKNEHFILLNEKLIKIADESISEEDLIPEIKYDTEISLEEINENLFYYLKKLEPFGYGNETPVFLLQNLEIIEIRKIGKEKNHLILILNNKKNISAVFFNFDQYLEVKEGDKINAVCNVVENEWMGRKSLELRIIDWERING